MTTTPPTLAPNHAADYLAVLTWLKQAVSDTRKMVATAFNGRDDADRLARLNALLMALSNQTTWGGPSAPPLVESAQAFWASFAAVHRELGSDLERLPRQAHEGAHRMLADGHSDPGVPVIRRSDFPSHVFGWVSLPPNYSGPGGLAVPWDSLIDPAHPARPFIRDEDLVELPGVGSRVIVLTREGAETIFSLEQVHDLTAKFGRMWADWKREDAKKKAYLAELERQRRESDPEWRIQQLEERMTRMGATEGVPAGV